MAKFINFFEIIETSKLKVRNLPNFISLLNDRTGFDTHVILTPKPRRQGTRLLHRIFTITNPQRNALRDCACGNHDYEVPGSVSNQYVRMEIHMCARACV